MQRTKLLVGWTWLVVGCFVLGAGCRAPGKPNTPPPEMPTEPTASSGR